MNMVRAFIAIDLSPAIQAKLQELLMQLKDRMPGLPVRWVPAQNIHLTLKFLGEVSVSNLTVLQQSLQQEVAAHRSFEVVVEGLGVFPSYRRPKVIWVGLSAPQELVTLQKRIEQEAERLGYSREDRGFTPHLTLGRVSRNANTAEIHRIGESVERYEVNTLGSMIVSQVKLYKSDLQPGGAIYTCLFTETLKEFI